MSRLSGIGVAGCLALTGCSGGAVPEGPVELALATGPAVTYAAAYQQDVKWGEADVGRMYGARYTVSADRESGDAAVRLDSLDIQISTPHGAQKLDVRYLLGIDFGISFDRRGGAPTYRDEPVVDMAGMLEQRVKLSRLMDYGFPDLPAEPVEVGATWSSSTSREQVEAQLTMPADISTDYRFAGWESVDGVPCAVVEGTVAGLMTGRIEPDQGPPLEYAGTLEGRITWLLDPASGTIVRVSGEERSTGVITAGAAETAIKQTTTIAIEASGA